MLIYLLKNKINNKIYVGQTTQSLKERLRQHKTKGHGLIGRAIKKYGFDNFAVHKLFIASSIEELNSKEEVFIKSFESLAPKGYNLKIGGWNAPMPEEQKRKISKFHKGKKLTSEHKKALTSSRLGKKNSDKQKLAASKAARKPKSLEHKKNLAKSKSKPVVGYNPNNGSSWFFKYPKESDNFGFSYHSIQKCLQKKQKSYKNYTWEHAKGL